MMNKKTITISIIILAIAIIAGGFWYTKNQNNVILNSVQDLDEQSQEVQKEKNVIPTKVGIQGEENDENIDISNWKTYQNEEFGFEVKLPYYSNYKQIDSNITFDLVSRDIIENLSISFSDTNLAWWEDSNREFPGYIKKMSEYHTDKYDVVYYESMQIIINPDEHIDDTPKEIIVAIVNINDDKFIEMTSAVNNFDDAMKIFNVIISRLQSL